MQSTLTLGLNAQRDFVTEAFDEAQRKIKSFIGNTHTAAKAAWFCVGLFIFGAVLFTGWHNWSLFARGANTDFGRAVAIVPAVLLDGSIVVLLVLLLTYFKDGRQWAVAAIFNALLFLIIGYNTSVDYSLNAGQELSATMQSYLQWGVAWSFLGTLALWEIIIHLDPAHKIRMQKARLEMRALRESSAAEVERIELELQKLTDELDFRKKLHTMMHQARMRATDGGDVQKAIADYETAQAVAEATQIRDSAPKAQRR
jgi:hypothetical protein